MRLWERIHKETLGEDSQGFVRLWERICFGKDSRFVRLWERIREDS